MPFRHIAVLIVSAWVPVYAVLFFTSLRPTGDGSGFARLAAIHVATFFSILAALAIAVREVWEDPNLDEQQRSVWMVLITLFMPVAAPAYLLRHRRGRRRA